MVSLEQSGKQQIHLKICFYFFLVRLDFQDLFFEVQVFSWFCHPSYFVLASQYFVSDKFSSYTSQSSDILSTQDTQLLTVFICRIGCNFDDLKPRLIASFSSAISSCWPFLCIPVSSLLWLQCLPAPEYSTVSQH